MKMHEDECSKDPFVRGVVSTCFYVSMNVLLHHCHGDELTKALKDSSGALTKHLDFHDF